MDATLPFRFLLLPGFDLAALGAASTVLSDAGTAFQTTALGDAPVPGDSGVHVAHGGPIPPFDPGDTLVVFAGLDLDEDTTEAALALLRRAERQGGRLWGIGGGVLLLAQLRLPDDVVLSANPVTAQALAKLRRRPRVIDTPFVWSPVISTARAAAAAALLRYDLSIAHRIEPDAAPLPASERSAEAARSQLLPIEDRYPTRNGTVLRGLGLMRANLFRPVSIAALSLSLGLSQRQLERLFEREVGDSPAAIYRAMRLEAARLEVRQGRRPMQDIAHDFGFTSGSFSKTYQRQFGVAPTMDRRAAMGA
ncbi:helix-turn-helix domain-containing protein [Nioella nitratireducens]|uniref:helix-turn-helix domain-containing protein n=1 Tax=Nioella nitratireducens TaxID=1287720 RepID=UPI0008FCF549|nr:helix-turn-helix domain-containing protein [Nioella nitratireducens]